MQSLGAVIVAKETELNEAKRENRQITKDNNRLKRKLKKLNKMKKLVRLANAAAPSSWSSDDSDDEDIYN